MIKSRIDQMGAQKLADQNDVKLARHPYNTRSSSSNMSPKENTVLEKSHNDDRISEPYPENELQPPVEIVWTNVIFHSLMHLGAIYGLFRLFLCQYITYLWLTSLYVVSAMSVTAGAHRLWSHRTYKAKFPLRFILVILNCLSMQNDIIEWSRDHRVHHKFSETNADPHNAKRGFFFAHVGWLLVKKHPDVIRKGRTLDFSDLYNEKLLVFQRRFYKPLVLLFCFAIPTAVPLMWNETGINAFFVCCLLRCCLTLNATWLVNSAAHLWGNRPYDININPAENYYVTTGSIGEGFHNYHHTFPQDYKASEYSWYFNLTTAFIDFMAWVGWAYDRKTVSKKAILERKKKTGRCSNY